MVAAPPPIVTSEGVLGVTPGASAVAVSKAWHASLTLVGSPGSPCSTTAIRVGRATGYAIFRKGRFAAVFFEAGASTDRGVRTGSSLAKLRSAYGSELVLRAASYFVVGRWQLRFDVGRNGTVSRIAFGDATVRLAAGCS